MIILREHLFTQLEEGGTHAVCDALQQAVKLEHATIPVYLYALYSLDPSKNKGIATTLYSVVLEEMLHMALACNVLNALGGSPNIDIPEFVPTYPGPLPGGIESGLVVHLAPYSMEQLASFLIIEEPENPLPFPVVAAGTPPRTIGQYYVAIKQQMALLPPGSFSPTPRNQVSSDVLDGIVEVTDLTTANQAIDTIVRQGEGTAESPLEAGTATDMAHYYRFAEVFHGRKLIPNPDATPSTPPDQRFLYKGDPIVFDPAGVYPVPKDPKAADYPAGSPARQACDTANAQYSKMLQALHLGVNGQPDAIDDAINWMRKLRQQAKKMMTGSAVSGTYVGPTFEYQGTAAG